MNGIESLNPVIRDLSYLMGDCAVELSIHPRDLTWAQFKVWMVDVRDADTGTVKQIQRAAQTVGGFAAVRDAMWPPIVTNNDMERQAIKKMASVNRKQVAVEATNLSLDREFEAVLNRCLPKLQIQVGSKANEKLLRTKTKISRKLNVMLSDTHIGARLDGREVLTDYGTVETSRRFAKIVDVVSHYKLDHRDETELHIYLGGDMIQGMLGHDPRDGAPLAEQWCEALYLLSQVIAKLASGYDGLPGFKKVKVYCTSGNHDRNIARHEQRATHEKWDGHATKLYYALKQKFEGIMPNVEISIPRTAWIDVPVFEHRVYVTHGDTNLNVGTPSSQINIKSLISQMHNINIGEVQAGRKPFKLFVVGHIHFGSFMQIPGGYFLITNPALVHRDSYGLNFGHGQAMGQQMWESTADNVVGDFRTIELDRTTDQDARLDRIIKPFKDFV